MCIYIYIQYIYVYIIPICSGHISVILALFLLLFIFGKVQRLGAITASQEGRRPGALPGDLDIWTSVSYFHYPVDLEWVVGGGINSFFADFTSVTLVVNMVKHVTYIPPGGWFITYHLFTDSLYPANHWRHPGLGADSRVFTRETYKKWIGKSPFWIGKWTTLWKTNITMEKSLFLIAMLVYQRLFLWPFLKTSPPVSHQRLSADFPSYKHSHFAAGFSQPWLKTRSIWISRYPAW